jgi:TonB family protein
MVDSTAAYERDPAPSYVPVDGTGAFGDRTQRAGSHQPDDLDGAGPEHASALLKMGALKHDAGLYSEAEELFGRALEIGERSVGADNPAIIPALTSLASARVMCGKLDDAQQLAVRAVAISERAPAEHEPDVAILINDLARLCLRESAHAVAEPLLLRLLEMKRSKGEDHPEVGTVLASLATVRHALGRHESAEQLWRRVLEIRERTLAPNHFSLAIALEHLGEACAARGKIAEALQLFQRAQTIRELTLGAAHPSLRTARDRIADLQLQAGESLDASQDAPAPTPEKYRLLAGNPGASSPFVSAPPSTRERPTQARKRTARVVEREQSQVIERASTVEDVAATNRALGATVAALTTELPNIESASYRDVILSIQQEIDEEEEGTKASTALGANLLASFLGALKERQKATVIGVAVVGLLVVLATVSRAWTEPDPSTPVAGASLAATHSVATPSGAEGSQRPTVPTNDPASAGATASAATTPVTASRIRLAEQRPSDQRPAKKQTEKITESTRISIPKGLSLSTARVDSIVRESGGSVGDPIGLQPILPTSPRLTFERDDQVNPRLRAQLIGPLPTPRYPAQLQGVEGELTARFEVDASGRPVMSTVSVVNSPHELLTAAVLKVIPGIRFEPARSGGENSKAVTDIVQLTFRFQSKK